MERIAAEEEEWEGEEGIKGIINIGEDYRSISTGYPVVISGRTRITMDPCSRIKDSPNVTSCTRRV